MRSLTDLQDRNVVVTIFAPSDVKQQEPMQIRGRIGYIGELADRDSTIEIDIDAASVEMTVPRKK